MGYDPDAGVPLTLDANARPYRVLCFGDSVTVGFWRDGQGYDPYGRTLAEVLGASGTMACEVCSLGLCGLAAKEMLESMNHRVVKDRVGRYGKGMLRAMEDDGPFDLAIIMAGTNDIGQRFLPEDIAAWTAQLHDTCAAYGLPTVAILPPTATKVSWARQSLLKLQKIVRTWMTIANPAPLACLDSEELVPRTVPGFWEPEEFHLSPPGSAELGRKLAALVRPMLCEIRPSCPGGGQHRILEPSGASLDLMGLVFFAVGDLECWMEPWCLVYLLLHGTLVPVGTRPMLLETRLNPGMIQSF